MTPTLVGIIAVEAITALILAATKGELSINMSPNNGIATNDEDRDFAQSETVHLSASTPGSTR